MSKYTSDDNRSMQLNPNNDRYYDSRGIDRHDDEDDTPCSGTMQFSQSMEFYFERHRQLREHACPVGCHQKSNYPVSQYDEYECEHQKSLKNRKRLVENVIWTQNHIRELEAQNKDVSYWKNHLRGRLRDCEISIALQEEEILSRKERAKAMPHIYR